MEYERVEHKIPPVYDENSRVLILGSMPSPKSREAGFYYGHPRNRFWKVLGAVFDVELEGKPQKEKRGFLLSHGIALWDVLSSCMIKGASDGSIRAPKPNDINKILSAAPIGKIFTTGGTAHMLYEKLCYPVTWVKAIPLPSPSPANCRISFEELVKEYRQIRSALAGDL
jgi:TDG/mug DNA glycosylase family protein